MEIIILSDGTVICTNDAVADLEFARRLERIGEANTDSEE